MDPKMRGVYARREGRAGACQAPLTGAGPLHPQPAPKTSVSSRSFWGGVGLLAYPSCPVLEKYPPGQP